MSAVTSESSSLNPFYVVVSEPMMGNGENCLDLNEGDIFLTTRYNKVGYWWGVSVYDLNNQGWFPSTFVQPYTGEVPEEASELAAQLRANYAKESTPVAQVEQEVTEDESHSKISSLKYNIVTNDSHKYQEYDVKTAVANIGKHLHIGNVPVEEEIEKEDFDYEKWAESKRESAETSKRSRKT